MPIQHQFANVQTVSDLGQTLLKPKWWRLRLNTTNVSEVSNSPKFTYICVFSKLVSTKDCCGTHHMFHVI